MKINSQLVIKDECQKLAELAGGTEVLIPISSDFKGSLHTGEDKL